MSCIYDNKFSPNILFLMLLWKLFWKFYSLIFLLLMYRNIIDFSCLVSFLYFGLVSCNNSTVHELSPGRNQRWILGPPYLFSFSQGLQSANIYCPVFKVIMYISFSVMVVHGNKESPISVTTIYWEAKVQFCQFFKIYAFYIVIVHS